MPYKNRNTLNTVEALQFKGGNVTDIHSFVRRHLIRNGNRLTISSCTHKHITISLGYYIIKDSNGNLKSYKPDVFEKLYDKCQ